MNAGGTLEASEYQTFNTYSRSSKSERIQFSDGRACSVHGPDFSKSEWKKMAVSLDRFI